MKIRSLILALAATAVTGAGTAGAVPVDIVATSGMAQMGPFRFQMDVVETITRGDGSLIIVDFLVVTDDPANPASILGDETTPFVISSVGGAAIHQEYQVIPGGLGGEDTINLFPRAFDWTDAGVSPSSVDSYFFSSEPFGEVAEGIEPDTIFFAPATEGGMPFGTSDIVGDFGSATLTRFVSSMTAGVSMLDARAEAPAIPNRFLRLAVAANALDGASGDAALAPVTLNFTGPVTGPSSGQNFNFSFEVVPEPATASMLGIIGAIGLIRRRR